MHELSVAESIINTVREIIKSEDLSKVEFVEVKIGMLSNILNESLQFCFNTIIEKTSLHNSRLKIVSPGIKIKCRECLSETEVNDFIFNCPDCFSSNIEVTGGDELTISKIYLRNSL